MSRNCARWLFGGIKPGMGLRLGPRLRAGGVEDSRHPVQDVRKRTTIAARYARLSRPKGSRREMDGREAALVRLVDGRRGWAGR
jgi:hypothetical protein